MIRLLQVLFIGLKLAEIVKWSWWLVMLPLILWLIIVVIVVIVEEIKIEYRRSR